MKYGDDYWRYPYTIDTMRQRERDAKLKRDDELAWETAVANLEVRMRYNNEH